MSAGCHPCQPCAQRACAHSRRLDQPRPGKDPLWHCLGLMTSCLTDTNRLWPCPANQHSSDRLHKQGQPGGARGAAPARAGGSAGCRGRSWPTARRACARCCAPCRRAGSPPAAAVPRCRRPTPAQCPCMLSVRSGTRVYQHAERDAGAGLAGLCAGKTAKCTATKMTEGNVRVITPTQLVTQSALLVLRVDRRHQVKVDDLPQDHRNTLHGGDAPPGRTSGRWRRSKRGQVRPTNSGTHTQEHLYRGEAVRLLRIPAPRRRAAAARRARPGTAQRRQRPQPPGVGG